MRWENVKNRRARSSLQFRVERKREEGVDIRRSEDEETWKKARKRKSSPKVMSAVYREIC